MGCGVVYRGGLRGRSGRKRCVRRLARGIGRRWVEQDGISMCRMRGELRLDRLSKLRQLRWLVDGRWF